MSFLLDTNVLSEIRKRVPDSGVARWFASVPTDRLYLSVLVVGEIRQGIERLARRDAAQAEMFERWLSELVDGYGDRRKIPVGSFSGYPRESAPSSGRTQSRLGQLMSCGTSSDTPSI
jgi:predicted nucleic acid-binding protein